jgi:hypothetical protein
VKIAVAFFTADTAAPMVLFGARLKLSVTDGNWPLVVDRHRSGRGADCGELAERTMPSPMDFA